MIVKYVLEFTTFARAHEIRHNNSLILAKTAKKGAFIYGIRKQGIYTQWEAYLPNSYE